MKLVRQLFAPLFGERRRRQDQHRTHQAALDQLLHHNASFDRLAQAYFIGQQRPPAHVAQGADRRFDLVLIMLDRQLFQTKQLVKTFAQP